jgi:LPXTG-motif cell wall-anchored protein
MRRTIVAVLALAVAVLVPAGPAWSQATAPTTTVPDIVVETTTTTTVETDEPTTTTTSTTEVIETTTTEDAGAAGAGVLPATGSSSAFPLAQLAIVLMAAGGLALIAMRREVPSEVTSRR